MIIKFTTRLYSEVLADLDRPHAHAWERVGFLFLQRSKDGRATVLQGVSYQSVQDEHYIPSSQYGAVINSGAIRRALETALRGSLSAFHVHKHSHPGRPWFSRTDLASLAELVPSFFGVAPGPHGALVFSEDKAAALMWEARKARPAVVDGIQIIGPPMGVLER